MSTFHKNWVLPGYVALCLILGGASAAGFVANAVIQLFAVAVIIFSLWNRTPVVDTPNMPLSSGSLFWIVGISIGWIVVQLIPLPPQIWQALPGRDFVQFGDKLLDMDGVWRPISLQPSRTLISAMSILPPLAVLLLTLRSSSKARTNTIWAIIIIAVISAFLGIVQLFQSSAGGAYFYKITNYGASVGFFANANHLATLFLVALLFSSELPFNGRTPANDKIVLWKIVKWSLVGFFAINTIVNGSVAGMGLLLAALTYVILRKDYMREMIGGSRIAIGAIVVVVSAAVGIFVWRFSGHLSTFAETSVEGEDRLEFATNTIRMIVDSFPFGYGLGTFRGAYLGYENLRTVTTTFVNHAHNEYLEFVADFGLVALAVIALYALWFVRRLSWMWKTRVLLHSYCYAAATSVVIVVAHSAVDYPLRTSAIAAIFAFATGCLAYPVVEKRRASTTASARQSRRSRSKF